MMENKKVKIFFFGSGAFAVPVLEALCLNPKIQMCGIITQPDKPAGVTPMRSNADGSGRSMNRSSSNCSRRNPRTSSWWFPSARF